MFSFLNRKEKGILLIGPIILVLIILFQGWQANHWHGQAVKESLLKEQWQKSYIALNENVAKFAEQQAELTAAINGLKAQQNQQTQDLNNALHKNQDWSSRPLPDDVMRVLNSTEHH